MTKAMANNEMGFGRSPLKFRHIYGEPAKKEAWYENIPTSKNAHDGRFIAANSRLLAIAIESTGGGSFVVIPQSRTGRMTGMNMPKICGHAGPILDLAWNPFDDSMIASASEDATVKLWRVDPDNGISVDMPDAEVELHGHRRRVMYIDWHPSANGLLLSAGYDHQIILWNVERRIPFQTIGGMTQAIHSIAWHPEGRLIACTNKDKTLRVMDPRSGVVIMSAQNAHSGPKASKTLFLDDNHLLSVGFGRHSDREYAVWSLDNNLSAPIQRQMIDQSSGVILPYYDPDCKVVYLIGKGDGNFRFYEYMEENVHYLSQYISSTPQRGVGVMPKRGLNMERCEIFRMYKQHVTSNVVEPLSIIAPRRGPFRDDLYPPTAASVPALTTEQWCYHGLNRGPVMMTFDGSLLNSSLPPGQSQMPAAQTRPAIPQSLLNVGHLTTEKEVAQAPTSPSALTYPAPGGRAPSPNVPINGHHHAAQQQQQQQPISRHGVHGRQEPVLRPQDRRFSARFDSEVAPPRIVEMPPAAVNRRFSAQVGMVGSQQSLLRPTEHETPRDNRELSAPPSALAEEDNEDKVANLRSLIQSFEKNTAALPEPASGSSSFVRTNRRAQSMRERSRRPVTTDFSNMSHAEAEAVGIGSRTRFIRRPESLQSPEEQRRSIELSLQQRTAVLQHDDESGWQHPNFEQQKLLSASLEQLSLPSVKDLVQQREMGDSFSDEDRSVSVATTPGTTSSTKVIEMRPRGGGHYHPESYEELQEAYRDQQREIKKLHKELKRRDREIESLKAQLQNPVHLSMNAQRTSSAVDSSFC